MNVRNYTFPSEFLQRIRIQLGDEEAEQLQASLSEVPQVAIRLHPWKGRRSDLPPGAEPVPWAPDEGFYLTHRPAFVLDPLWHAGAYYVQDASSMFIPYLLPPSGPLNILDFAAAPGGKSTHLLSYISQHGGTLTANEPEASRFPTLLENLARWGIASKIITRGWPSDWQGCPPIFDVVLVDAPCSGEGMFRKLPASRTEWSLRRVVACSRTQRDILSVAIQLVRPGGLLIYSTCTFSPEENEEQVRWIYDVFGAIIRPHFREVPPDWGIVVDSVLTSKGEHPIYKFYPHRVRGEGLTVTAFVVNGSFPRRSQRNYSLRQFPCPSSWPIPRAACIQMNCEIRAIPDETFRHLQQLPILRHMEAGVGIARSNRKTIRPHPEWPFSQGAYSPHSHPVVPLDYKSALQYLQGHPLPLPPNMQVRQSTWVLLAYQQRFLGWGKALPSGRINNAYPPKWRIRKPIS